MSSGHVFVVQGVLPRLDHDAVVVPTDNSFDVGGHWSDVLGTGTDARGHSAARGLRPDGWQHRRYGRAKKQGPGTTPPLPTWFIDAA